MNTARDEIQEVGTAVRSDVKSMGNAVQHVGNLILENQDILLKNRKYYPSLSSLSYPSHRF